MENEGIDKKCLYVQFESLTKNPKYEMERIYKYLELPEFQHDFQNVEQITQEDDAVYGMAPNLHKIRNVVEDVKPDYIDVLGEGFCKWIDEVCAGYQKSNGYG